MTRRLAVALALALPAALPASASAHTIKGLVHDARDVVTAQAPGTETHIASDGVRLVVRRTSASVVEVLDLQGVPALRLDERGAWARKGAPIVTVLSVETGAPDPANPAWLSIGGGDSLRFHYPGTHGEVLHRWSVPLRVDGRATAIEGAVERVPRPPLAWAIGAGLALAAGAGLVLVLAPRRRATYALVAGLALAGIAISYGESEATGRDGTGVCSSRRSWPSPG